MRKIISLVLLVLMIMGMAMVFSSCGGSSGGGKCKYCGTHTNWTYKGGGYVCWICDH